MNAEEEWAPIPGWTEYSVSTLGRVRSEARVVMRKNGRAQTVHQRILSAAVKPRTGYRQVLLHVKGRGVLNRFVHQLVLLAHVGPPPAGHESCHNDGDPANNSLTNLRYGTHADNCADKVCHGTGRGVRNAQSVLTDSAVIEIRRRRSSGLPVADIARAFGVCGPTVSNVCNRKSWRHVLAGDGRGEE